MTKPKEVCAVCGCANQGRIYIYQAGVSLCPEHHTPKRVRRLTRNAPSLDACEHGEEDADG